MKRTLASVMAMIAAITGCDPVTVPMRDVNEVYDFRLPLGGDSLVLRWPNGSRIGVFLVPVSDPARNMTLMRALRRGAAAWENVNLYRDFTFVQVSQPGDADMLLTWSDATLPVIVAECQPGGGAAYTTFCVPPSRDRLYIFPLTNDEASSRVRFLVTIRSSEAANAEHVVTLVTHELGHVLGLAQHSHNSNDLMFADPVGRTQPNARDRATLQLLYQIRPDITP